MGNCQAAEAATVVIQHPGGKIERVYWSLSARHVMAANPGHYVAVIITAPSSSSSSSTTNRTNNTTTSTPQVKHLKLLRPDDTLLIGHVYRLVSFQEVLKEFASKKHIKVSRLVVKPKERDRMIETESSPPAKEERKVEEEEEGAGSNSNSNSSQCRRAAAPRPGQWKPALQSIAEGGIGS